MRTEARESAACGIISSPVCDYAERYGGNLRRLVIESPAITIDNWWIQSIRRRTTTKTTIKITTINTTNIRRNI